MGGVKVHLINGYSETVHPDNIIEVYGYVAKELAFPKDQYSVPKLYFPLLGRGFGAELVIEYKDVPESDFFSGWYPDTNRDFETVSCFAREKYYLKSKGPDS